MKWLTTEPPKDGRKILRFHLCFKCVVTVYYNYNNSLRENGKSNGCVWTTGTLENTWPEAAFAAEWAEAPEYPKSYKPFVSKRKARKEDLQGANDE